MSSASRPPLHGPSQIEGMDEAAWVDVIGKMEEVYSQLVRDEIALEEKNTQLEQSQQFIFSLLTAMSDVLVACDENGRIEETNAALRELAGRSEEALRGRPLAELLAGDGDRERLRVALDNAPRRGSTIELELLDAQRQPVPVDFNITPRFSLAGQLVGHVFVGRPLGELKRAYHQLREAHEALKRTQQQLLHSEKMASLGRLVAGVAHELNNPISFVLGNVHALQRYTERLREYLAAIHAQAGADEQAKLRAKLRIDHLLADLPSLMEGTLEGAQRTADIVQGLKRFSAMDRGERSEVDLNGVIERATLLANPSIAWVADILSQTNAVQAGPYLTGHSYQFTADIAAVGHYGRGFRRVKFVFDTSEGAPRVIFRQDLTHLGWPLGKDVRNVLLTAATRP